MLREIRDPIHGFIDRTKDEASVIDCFSFQRLRNIKQLALANLVYPGATHTRFQHSIGVMHIAGKLGQKMVNQNVLSAEELKTTRLAALLHDIGHGPFSHVSENLLEKYYDKGKVKPKNREKIHEEITCLIIENDPSIAKIISKAERTEIVGLISNENYSNPIMKGIVSGPLDADKQDYLLRDSYYCGVKYGIYDIDRLIHSINPFKQENLCVPAESIYTLEQFLLAKYHMSTQVYRHRIRLITDKMITRGIELGIEKDNIKWLKELYTFKKSQQFIRNYIQWDDSRLINKLLFENKTNNYSYKIFNRLRIRNLYKCVFSQNLSMFSDPKVTDVISKINSNPELTRILEEEVSRILSKHFSIKIDKFEVIINQFSIKSVKKSYRDDEGSILITSEDGVSTFEQKSALFKSINETITEQYLEIYAPVVFRNYVEKTKRLPEIQKEIESLITSKIISFIKVKSKVTKEEG